MIKKEYNKGEFIYIKESKMDYFNIILSGEVVKKFTEKEYTKYKYKLYNIFI